MKAAKLLAAEEFPERIGEVAHFFLCRASALVLASPFTRGRVMNSAFLDAFLLIATSSAAAGSHWGRPGKDKTSVFQRVLEGALGVFTVAVFTATTTLAIANATQP